MLYEIFVIAILILTFYFIVVQESFISCRDCSNYYVNQHMSSVVNPYSWPYSGNPCVDDINLMKMNGTPPLTHLNTPDHVELVN